MTFLAPARLWLLVAVVALAGAYVVLQQRRRHYAVRFTNLELLDTVAPRRPGWRRHVAAGALLAALAALTIGFARPVHDAQVARRGATLLVAIDTSGSMAATDVTPSRLDAAEQAAKDFVTSLPAGLRVGLVSFDAGARLVVSPTTDHAAVARAVGTLQLGTATAGGEAIFTSLAAIASDAAATRTPRAVARIVFMSDGATTIGRTLPEAAAAAKDAKVPVSTIAYGTDAGTVTINGEVIPVPADRPALKAVADATGGTAFDAPSGKQLAAAYRSIGRALRRETQRREATAVFTGVGLLLAAAGVTASLIWGGRIL